MEELIGKSLFFGVAVSVVGYETGLWIKKRVKSPLCNPLLISIAFVMVVLGIFRVDYGDCFRGIFQFGYGFHYVETVWLYA